MIQPLPYNRHTQITVQGFAYGLLDTLNKHFQNTLHIDRTRSAGLQAAYFGYTFPVNMTRARSFWIALNFTDG